MTDTHHKTFLIAKLKPYLPPPCQQPDTNYYRRLLDPRKISSSRLAGAIHPKIPFLHPPLPPSLSLTTMMPLKGVPLDIYRRMIPTHDFVNRNPHPMLVPRWLSLSLWLFMSRLLCGRRYFGLLLINRRRGLSRRRMRSGRNGLEVRCVLLCAIVFRSVQLIVERWVGFLLKRPFSHTPPCDTPVHSDTP
jgi:hypothetical protein